MELSEVTDADVDGSVETTLHLKERMADEWEMKGEGRKIRGGGYEEGEEGVGR